jgi:hypothetical protein
VAREKTRDPRPPRPAHANLPATFLLRVVLLASVAIVGSVWALVRFYTHPKLPMTIPAAAAAAQTAPWDAGAGLVEVEVDTR